MVEIPKFSSFLYNICSKLKVAIKSSVFLCVCVRVVEDAADRVFMAARLFVRFFNQRGGSLQQRILELLELADAADNFHKKTVTASFGGGVASVAGSVTTITGLILAPFTAGTSLIVTAVGIGVATAGGVASASANITDTVHSKTDRKKVEKMIHDYEEEIKDIKECLEFLQVRIYSFLLAAFKNSSFQFPLLDTFLDHVLGIKLGLKYLQRNLVFLGHCSKAVMF